MKRAGGIPTLIVALIALTGSAAAQQPGRESAVAREPRERPADAISAAPIVDDPAYALPPLRADARTLYRDLPLLREDMDPILRERRRIRRALQQRADEQTPVIARPRTSAPDANRTAGLWRISIGNTSMENWSPYPDRALDARVLRFPHPRELRHDKRPLHVQRMEQLNKTNK